MLLAEAGYPNALVHPSEDGDSPTVMTRNGEEVIVPDDVASTALALWANSHGLGHERLVRLASGLPRRPGEGHRPKLTGPYTLPPVSDDGNSGTVRPGAVRIDTSRGSADEARRIARARQAEQQRQVAVRRMEILQRRINGQTFTEIAAVLGMSEAGVRKAYRSALKDHYRTAAEEERETALLRADNIVRRWSPRLLSEDDEVAERATRNLLRAMHFQADRWGMKSHTVHVDGEVRRRVAVALACREGRGRRRDGGVTGARREETGEREADHERERRGRVGRGVDEGSRRAGEHGGPGELSTGGRRSE